MPREYDLFTHPVVILSQRHHSIQLDKRSRLLSSIRSIELAYLVDKLGSVADVTTSRREQCRQLAQQLAEDDEWPMDDEVRQGLARWHEVDP